MLRTALVLMCLFYAAPAPAAEPNAVPTNYAECKKDAPYTEKTGLRCTYAVPLDKSNSEKTKDYFACQSAKPNWQFLKTFKCEFADYDDLSKPRFARCIRDKMPTVFPPKFDDDCRHLFYNPDYAYPKSLEECMAQDDHKEDVTLELKQICYIKLSYKPETANETFDADDASKIIEKCQLAGGEAEVVDKKYPECRLIFVEK